jgi:hypothetical protein
MGGICLPELVLLSKARASSEAFGGSQEGGTADVKREERRSRLKRNRLLGKPQTGALRTEFTPTAS